MLLGESMEYKPIEEILTKDQIRELRMKLVELREKGLTPDDPEFIEEIKKLLGKYKKELEKRRVYSDYLAYVVAFWVSTIGYNNLIEFLKAKEMVAKKKLDDIV